MNCPRLFKNKRFYQLTKQIRKRCRSGADCASTDAWLRDSFLTVPVRKFVAIEREELENQWQIFETRRLRHQRQEITVSARANLCQSAGKTLAANIACLKINAKNYAQVASK